MTAAETLEFVGRLLDLTFAIEKDGLDEQDDVDEAVDLIEQAAGHLAEVALDAHIGECMECAGAGTCEVGRALAAHARRVP